MVCMTVRKNSNTKCNKMIRILDCITVTVSNKENEKLNMMGLKQNMFRKDKNR